jgi:hypothetical protein
MAKKTKTQKYANPVTGEYAEMITDAPYDNVDYTQASIVDDLLPKAVAESMARPTDIVNEANEAINKDYPWAVPSMTAFNRALLVELYRIRKALETK